MLKNIGKVLVATTIAICSAGCVYERSSPDLAERFYVTSQLLAETGQLDAALDELTKAVEACPSLAIAHSAMGDIHRSQGQLELARRAYESSCEINPYAFRAHYRLGVTYQDLSELKENLSQARKYVLLAVSNYLRAVHITPSDYDANLNLAACYFELDNAPMAEQYCRAAIKCDPKKQDAYINLSVILETQGKYYDAITASYHALEFDGEKYGILMDIAGVYVKQDRLTAAIGVYKDAIKEKPANAKPIEKIGQCHMKLNQYLQAMQAFEQVVKLDPNRYQGHYGIGAVYMSLFLKNPENATLRDQALKSWNRSLELQPNQPSLIRLVKKYTPKPAEPNL